MERNVKSSQGDASTHFVIANRMKQGCVLASVLFILFFTCMLSHAVKNLEERVYVRYRLDGSLFDLRRRKAKTKTFQTLLQEALFYDDLS